MTAPVGAAERIKRLIDDIVACADEEGGGKIDARRDAVKLVKVAQKAALDEVFTLREQAHYANGVADLAMKHRDAAEAEVATLRAERDKLADEIAVAREACPAGRMQDYMDAPLLVLVNKEVSRGFNRDAEIARQAEVIATLRARLTQMEAALGSLVALYGPDTDYHHVIEPHAWAEILALLSKESSHA